MLTDRTEKFLAKYVGFIPAHKQQEFIRELTDTIMRDGCNAAAEFLKGLAEGAETKEPS